MHVHIVNAGRPAFERRRELREIGADRGVLINIAVAQHRLGAEIPAGDRQVDGSLRSCGRIERVDHRSCWSRSLRERGGERLQFLDGAQRHWRVVRGVVLQLGNHRLQPHLWRRRGRLDWRLLLAFVLLRVRVFGPAGFRLVVDGELGVVVVLDS